MKAFETGDKVVYSLWYFTNKVIHIDKIVNDMVILLVDGKEVGWGFGFFRHATNEEINLGHRIDGSNP